MLLTQGLGYDYGMGVLQQYNYIRVVVKRKFIREVKLVTFSRIVLERKYVRKVIEE